MKSTSILTGSAAALILLAACGNSAVNTGQPAQRTNSTPQKDADQTPTVMNETATDRAARPGESGDTSGVRQVGEHVHGGAKLALALDGNRLVIELETPLFNLTGLEHAPDTQEEKNVFETAKTILSQPGNLFSVNAPATCEPTPARVDVSLGFEDAHPSDTHDDHGEQDASEELHGDTHEDHHEDHDSHSESDDHAKSVHRDVIVAYTYTCALPEALTTVSTRLFEHFPGMASVETVYLGPNAQLQSTLTPRKSVLQLKP